MFQTLIKMEKKNEHETTCDLCGQIIDLSSLNSVLHHLHAKTEAQLERDIIGVRVDPKTFNQDEL